MIKRGQTATVPNRVLHSPCERSNAGLYPVSLQVADDGLKSGISLDRIAFLLFRNSSEIAQFRNFREKFQLSTCPPKCDLKLSLV